MARVGARNKFVRVHRPPRKRTTSGTFEVTGPTGAEGTPTTAGNHDATTTLNGGINASVTTITVTDGSTFGTGLQIIVIDNERILTTSRSGNVFTVKASTGRGYQRTTAAAHSNGATVRYP